MSAQTLTVSGSQLIAGRESRAGSQEFRAFDPVKGRDGDIAFAESTPEEIAAAAAAAAQAFAEWPQRSFRERSALLRAVATRLEAWRREIISIADEETGLGTARLNGELDRTTGQLRMFADLVDEGSYVEAVISPADPAAKPIPRPDVRRMLVPLGPVAVFTPSNFPLAFGIAGGDTASALAAGCPVVVKGHPSHPGSSEACGRALAAAVADTSAPAGAFSLVQARDPAVARTLVMAPEIAAVAFTGGFAAGRAIYDLAASRPQPIPVYAEMGSINPVFVAPEASRARTADIAEGLANSITLGTGQFCTKPGVVFVPDDDAGRSLSRMLAERLTTRPPGVMLNRAICQTLDRQAAATRQIPGVEALTPSTASDGCSRRATLLTTTIDTWLATPALVEEHFGPLAIIVLCDPARMADAARHLPGTLTATLHADPADTTWAKGLANTLAGRAGRLVWNGYPTGVAVVPAMQHGGPYPASTASLQTSVGTTAIRRFLRPVAWQNAPNALLPAALQAENPLGIQRQIEGVWGRE